MKLLNIKKKLLKQKNLINNSLEKSKNWFKLHYYRSLCSIHICHSWKIFVCSRYLEIKTFFLVIIQLKIVEKMTNITNMFLFPFFMIQEAIHKIVYFMLFGHLSRDNLQIISFNLESRSPGASFFPIATINLLS